MSKVSITIEVDRYICTELDEVRTMITNLDFSGLKASVERIQKHANAMESAIRNYNNYMNNIKRIIDNTDDDYNSSTTKKKPLTAKEQIKEIKTVLEQKYPAW